MGAVVDESRALVAKLVEACEMIELSIDLMRQNIRRAFPLAPSHVVEEILEQWLLEYPRCEATRFMDLAADGRYSHAIKNNQ